MKLNKELFLKLADAIEREKRFDLESWVSTPTLVNELAEALWDDRRVLVDGDACGTTMCVCGWVNWLTRRKGAKTLTAAQFEDRDNAARKLGITAKQANSLFMAEGDTVWLQYAKRYHWDHDEYGLYDWSCIKPHQAARVLRDIANGLVTL